MILDGHSLAYRAFYALASTGLCTSRGEATYAVFGFVQMLLAVIQEYDPTYLAIAFDVGRTFRHELAPEYKAGRATIPQTFLAQFERMKQFTQAMGIPAYTIEGYEADDIIGTLARQASLQGIPSLILSGDTDILQLVDAHTTVLLSNLYGRKTTTTWYDLPRVIERYHGLHPHQLADLRGLKGDTSDNIPGVRGIGEAGAIHLLQRFGTIETLYDNLPLVEKRYRKYLEGQREQALLSKRLATIICDVPGVTLDLPGMNWMQHCDRDAVLSLFRELEFASLIKRWSSFANPIKQVPSEEHHTPPHPTQSSQLPMFSSAAQSPHIQPLPVLGDYRAVTTEEALDELIRELAAAPAFAFDTETSGLHPLESDLVGISLATRPGIAWYIPLAHQQAGQLASEDVLERLRPWFANPQQVRYAHHAKFDMLVMQQAGVPITRVTFDTMIAAGLLNKRRRLKELASSELHLPGPMMDITDLIGTGKKQVSFAQVPIEQATPYAAADADMTLRLVEVLEPQIAADEQLSFLFHQVEMPLIPILAAMEWAGIGVDVPYLRELSRYLEGEIARLEQEIFRLAGVEPFNINSAIQLHEVLFERLRLPTGGLPRTASGRYALDARTLEMLRESHAVISPLLEHRHLSKLKSTYTDTLPTLVNPRTGRIHTTYQQIGTATGRLASASPNLQNIPVRTEIGGEIRRAFIAAPGHQFVAADYSQIELRVLAHMSRDPALIQAFHEGLDIHTATAAQLFQIPMDHVEPYQRRIAKTTVFGIIYGISSFGLAQRTGLGRSAAQALIDAFFARFPRVREFLDQTLEHGRMTGYVQSLFGRRRPVPDLRAQGPRRQAAEREAMNMPIQSTAADLMKLAMIAVARRIEEQHLQTRMLLQVHDELILEAPLAEVEQVVTLVRAAMEQVYSLLVPLTVEVKVGPNWEHLEPF